MKKFSKMNRNAPRPQKSLGQIHHAGLMDLSLDPLLATASPGGCDRESRAPERNASAGRQTHLFVLNMGRGASISESEG